MARLLEKRGERKHYLCDIHQDPLAYILKIIFVILLLILEDLIAGEGDLRHKPIPWSDFTSNLFDFSLILLIEDSVSRGSLTVRITILKLTFANRGPPPLKGKMSNLYAHLIISIPVHLLICSLSNHQRHFQHLIYS